MGKRPQTDPTTLSGKQGDLGGGGALELLEEKSLKTEVDSREFSEPNPSAPVDLQSVWDGMSGSGTESDPKIITNDHELQAINQEASSYYILGENIDCSGTEMWNGRGGFNPIDSFKGQLDARGKVIKGVTVSTTDGNFNDAGLFDSIFSSTTKDVVVRNLVIYDCDFSTPDSDAGGLAGTFSRSEPPDQYRRIIENVIVLGCYIEADNEASGLTSYTGISTDIKNCAVVNCEIVQTSTKTTAPAAAELTASVGGYSWGSGDESLNYSVLEGLYAYNNTTSIQSGDTTVLGYVYVNSDVNHSPEFMTDVSNVFISGEAKADTVLETVQGGGSSGASSLSVTGVYSNGEITDVGSYSSGGSATVEVTTLTESQITGDSVVSNAPDADFESVWSVATKNVETSVYADGLPVLNGLDSDLQLAIQGLGDPRIGESIGVTPTGELINTSLKTEPETNPLRRTFPEDTRVGSKFQKNQGVLTTLQDVPKPVYGNAVIQDPSDGDWIISIGGDVTNTEYRGNIAVQCYNVKYDYWDVNRYPDITDTVYNLPAGVTSGGEDFYMPAAGGTGEKTVVVAGGQFFDASNNSAYSDQVFYLDIEYGSWGASTSTLPNAIDSPAYSVYNGELYVFGGGDSNAGGTSQVVSIEPISDTITTSYSTTPYPLEDANPAPVVDGKAYVMGCWNGASGDGYIGDGTPLFSYDLESDVWTPLAEINTLLYYGQEVGTVGLTGGNLVEYEGNLVAIDGYNYFGKSDISYYSIEGDEWAPVDKPELPDGSTPWDGSNRGPVIDGVVYMPGAGSNQESLWAYIPEKDPFGGN